MREKEKGLELKRISRGYYVYRAVGVWDKEKKKSVKQTVYLGSIDADGVFHPKRLRPIPEKDKEVYEYGNAMLALNLLEDCRKQLGGYRHLDEIMAMSVLKAVDPCPLRLMQSKWAKLYPSTFLQADLRPSYLSRVLREMGGNLSRWYDLYSSLVPNGDLLLYDLTSIISYSENVKLAARGYNKDHVYKDQVGVVMAFSTTNMLPVGVDVFSGSIRDVSTIRDFLARLKRNDIGFILDTGFTGEPLLRELRREKIGYVVPLKRNSKEYDHPVFDTFFEYRDRGVQAAKKPLGEDYLYIYRDPLLRGEEESTLIKRLEKKSITMETFNETAERAGIIMLRSSFDIEPEKVYDLYKGREDVEQVFDMLKNTLESDKTYMHSQEALKGYMIITFLATRIHYKILKRLKEEGVSKKISVEEALFELSKLEVIREKTGAEYHPKIPKKTREIEDLFPEIHSMG